LVPAGFSDDSGAKFIGHGWKYRTMVFVSTHDLIEVLANPLSTDIAAQTPAQRQQWFDGQKMNAGSSGITTASPLVPTLVDGAIARTQYVIFGDGGRMQSVTVERGKTLMNIRCEWNTADGTRDANAVRTACTQILASIQIISL
jgi:hypothetical protein